MLWKGGLSIMGKVRAFKSNIFLFHCCIVGVKVQINVLKNCYTADIQGQIAITNIFLYKSVSEHPGQHTVFTEAQLGILHFRGNTTNLIPTVLL